MNVMVVILISLICYLALCFVLSKIFAKINIKKGYAYIPFFNFVKLLEKADLKWYYIFGFLISPINIWFSVYFNIKLGKSLIKVMDS